MNTRALREHLAAGGAAIFNLNSRAKFRLSGEDRVRYLNGQVSNDIRKVDQQKAQPACVMTAKGKMNGLIWVAAEGEALLIDAEEFLRESLAARLERYIIADDAVLDDVTEEQGLVHILGLSASPESALNLPGEVSWHFSKRFGVSGLDITGSRDILSHLVQAEGAVFDTLSGIAGPEGIVAIDAETEETFRIECGIPRWGRELDENTIPVEAGLEGETIDYHKGCYIGQEIISRIKSIGRVNRNLRGFLLNAPVDSGAALYEGEKQVGTLTSVIWSDTLDSTIALGYLRRGIEATTLQAGAATADVHTLPFLAL